MFDLREILLEGRKSGASDIHLAGGTPPRMRVGGRLVEAGSAKLQHADILEVVLTVMNESQREQFDEQGEYELAYSMPSVGRYRVNAYRQRGAVALTFRAVAEGCLSLREKNIPETVLELGNLEKGLVLFAGEAGSGRTTTMAAVLDYINRNRAVHIITLEETIEYVHQHESALVSQREMGKDAFGYGNGLKRALREDADVIMVEQLTDGDAVRGALMASRAGCLVLAGVYGASVGEAVSAALETVSDEEQCRICRKMADELAAVVIQKKVVKEGGICEPVFQVLMPDSKIKEKIRQGLIIEI